jgi:hypothetical protein
MAAPLPKEDKVKILDYLRQQDLSDLTGVKIKELVKEDLGIDISQPTASKLKGEILEDSSDEEEFLGNDSSLEHITLFEETDTKVEPIKPDKTRQLSLEQMNAIEYLLQGQSDRAVAGAVGVSRQAVWDWRNNDPLFIAELNRQRVELWREARERLKSLANRALDVVEQQLNSGDPKAALAAAKYVLQGTKLLGDTDLSIKGPMTPEEVILEKLRSEARQELKANDKKSMPKYPVLGYDSFEAVAEQNFTERVDDLAKSRLMNALAEAGLSSAD